MVDILIDAEPRWNRCYLVQHPARLAKIDGTKVLTVQDGRDLHSQPNEFFTHPELLVFIGDRKRNVMNGSQTVYTMGVDRRAHHVHEMPGPIEARRESCAIGSLIYNIETQDIRQEGHRQLWLAD